MFAECKPLITLKDHRPRFDTKSTYRLINPAKGWEEGHCGPRKESRCKRLKYQIQPMAKYCWGDWFVLDTPKQKESGIYQIWYRIVLSYSWRDICKAIEWVKSKVEITPCEEKSLYIQEDLSFLMEVLTGWNKTALILMLPWVPMMEPKCVSLLDCTCYTCTLTVLTKRISVCTEMMSLSYSPWQENRLIKPEKIL